MKTQLMIGVSAMALGAFFAHSQAQPAAPFEQLEKCFYSYAKSTDLCGFVRVPENRQDPNNQRQIKIAVIVRKATAPNPKPDPIVFLEGGPGGSGTAAFGDKLRFLAQRTPDRDLVMVDQRGTGYSEPLLDCSVEGQNSRISEYTQLALCRQRLATITDLKAYNTDQNARDIQDVVKILGYSSWNMVGASYGTRLALTILEQKPENLRSVVLDSVFATHINVIDQANGILGVWNRTYAKQKALINNVAAGIERGTVRAKIEDVWWALVSTPDEKAVERRLNELRNLQAPERQIQFLSTPPSSRQFSYPMALSTICQEEFANADFTRGAATLDSSWSKSLVDYVFKTGFLQFQERLLACQIWNVGSTQRVTGFVKSNIPTLVLGDTNDINTPLEWSTATARELGNAQLITTKKQGHVTSKFPCGAALVQGFFDNPSQAVAANAVPECKGSIVPNPK